MLSEAWVKQSLSPTVPKTDYGYMNWFLNTGRKFLPSAPETAFTHVGNGNNLVYVDPEHELVAVIRWIDGRSQDAVIAKIIEALPVK